MADSGDALAFSLIVRSGVLRLATLCLVAAIGCSAKPELAAGVTCTGVRALRLGLSPAEVTRVLGEPLTKTPGPECNLPGSVDECWSYSSGPDTQGYFRMWFRDGGLDYASAARIKLSSFSGKPTLAFQLDQNGPREFPEFEGFFSCSEPP